MSMPPPDPSAQPADDPVLDRPKWYHSTAVVVAALVLFFPIGLVLLWTHPRYTQKTKIVATGITALAVLVVGISDAVSEKDDIDTVVAGDEAKDTTTSTTTITSTTTTAVSTTITTTTEPPTAPPTTATTTAAPSTTTSTTTTSSTTTTEPTPLGHASGCDFVDEMTVRVTPHCLAEQWPLTSSSAEVYCNDDAPLMRIPAEEPGGGIYPLTGFARTRFPELPELEEVWLENPDLEGAHINIGPITQIARDLC